MSYPSSLPSYTPFVTPITLADMHHAVRHRDMERDITSIATKVGTGVSTPAAGKVLVSTGAGVSEWSDDVTITTLHVNAINEATPAAGVTVEGTLIKDSGMLLNSGLNNLSTRPAVGATRIPGEIFGLSDDGPTRDDGFLRLSAGGGTAASTKSFIDLSGFSVDGNMNQKVVIGTSGVPAATFSSADGSVINGVTLKDGWTSQTCRTYYYGNTTNLDTIKASGIYGIYARGDNPYGGGISVLQVNAYSPYWIVQVLWYIGSTNISPKQRMFHSGTTWTAWKDM